MDLVQDFKFDLKYDYFKQLRLQVVVVESPIHPNSHGAKSRLGPFCLRQE